MHFRFFTEFAKYIKKYDLMKYEFVEGVGF